MWMWIFSMLLALGLHIQASHVDPGPQQIHIAIGGVDSAGMTISWVSSRQGDSRVKYGPSPTELVYETKATEPAKQYQYCKYTSGYMHHVLLPSLVPNTTYSCKLDIACQPDIDVDVVGDDAYGWSKAQTFKTPPKRGDLNSNLVLGILGDLGQTNYSMETLGYIQSQKDIDAVLLAGDLSYADTVQSRWDEWGKLVEPSISAIPWMMAPGNHEIEISCHLTTFDAYQARYRMPFEESHATRGNLFYSFDIGSVHVIVLTPYIPTYKTSEQYVWLEQDLDHIDRTVTPWIIVVMHGPWYSSNKAHQNKHEPQHVMRHDMESLLFDHRVHLVLAGHVHSYERTFPVYKNELTVNAPTYITIGDGGNREGLADKYIHPKPAWSAFRKARYGYGLLFVKNQTHALFEWHEDEAENSIIQDSVWIHAAPIKHQRKKL